MVLVTLTLNASRGLSAIADRFLIIQPTVTEVRYETGYAVYSPVSD